MATESKSFEAIVVSEFGSENVLQLVTRPLESFGQLGPKQVRVAVRATGVNPVDTYIRSGNYGRLPKLPYTPGADGAGDIIEVGSEVSQVAVGDRVYLAGPHTGSYSQMAVISEDSVQPLPPVLSYAQGACIQVPFGTAYRALFIRGGAKPGDVVLVHGATGAVGSAAIQLCRYFGIKAIGTGSQPNGREMILRLGASAAFNHRDTNYMAEIKAFTGGRGVDLVIEMLANVNLEADIGILARGGRVMVVGNRGTITINPRGLMVCEGDVRGVAMAKSTPEDHKLCHSAIAPGLSSGALVPQVAEEIPLVDAPQAHVSIMSSGRSGNLVMLPYPSSL